MGDFLESGNSVPNVFNATVVSLSSKLIDS